MNYNEFTTYLAERIIAVRSHENRRAFSRNYSSYCDAVSKAVLECRAFFNHFSLDEGPHNDYNPNSKVSVEAYRAAIHAQIAAAIGKKAGGACVMHNEGFLKYLRMESLRYDESVSDQRFARVVSEYVTNVVFVRNCAGCGASYEVEVKAQTYSMFSNHPTTCKAVQAAPVQAVKPKQPRPVQVEKPGTMVMSDDKTMNEMAKNFLTRYNAVCERDRQRELARTGPSTPDEMLKPTHKPDYIRPSIEPMPRLRCGYMRTSSISMKLPRRLRIVTQRRISARWSASIILLCAQCLTLIQTQTRASSDQAVRSTTLGDEHRVDPPLA